MKLMPLFACLTLFCVPALAEGDSKAPAAPLGEVDALWEVDVFGGSNNGLILAEVELESVDEHVDLPDWIAGEVSHDHRYSNAYLCMHPWPVWGRDKGAP